MDGPRFLYALLAPLALMALVAIALGWVFLLAAPEPPSQIVEPALVRPRPRYDTSLPFHALVKPHFYAKTENGEWREVRGEPERIVEHNGQVTVRLRGGGEYLYLSLLALESEEWGEHPVQKVYRLRAMGVPLDPALEKKFHPQRFAHTLFPGLRFEYLPGKDTEGVISEVFPDGTFLVIPYQTPPEWRGATRGLASPLHFHVDPRALITKTSPLAREWEKEILALPFADQRYPPAPLAKKGCQVYQEALEGAEYRRILSAVGYRFTPSSVWRGEEAMPSFGERFAALLWGGSGKGKQYFGMEGEWIADRLREMGEPVAQWVQACDAAGGIRFYPSTLRNAQQDSYIILRRSLEPDKKQRYRILSLAQDGSGREVYRAPGAFLLVFPHPTLADWWVMSTEGWDDSKGEQGPDPRASSLYMVYAQDPSRYLLVDFPFSRYSVSPKTPTKRLLGSAGLLQWDRRFLLVSLYGFTEEGGGLWLVDLSAPAFYQNPAAFTYLQPWDHALTLLPLDYQESPPTLSLFLTAKEVQEGFAMTAYFLRIVHTGVDAKVEGKERLLRMAGWNPVPFAIQQVGEHRFRVLVETFYDYRSSLLPRAKGVYIVSVETSMQKGSNRPSG